jgi:hypothetical protein
MLLEHHTLIYPRFPYRKDRMLERFNHGVGQLLGLSLQRFRFHHDLLSVIQPGKDHGKKKNQILCGSSFHDEGVILMSVDGKQC